MHADPTMGPAGLRALLLQALHPLAMAGVAQHSDFRTDPWGRLQRTAGYVATVTYAPTAQAQRAAARVRGIHRQLGGVELESGVAYRVSDPKLLLWVHCCEVESFLTTYRRCGGRVGPGEADRYYAEQLTAATLVGLDPADVPADEAAVDAYFQSMRPRLWASAEARRAARFVLVPPMPTRVRLATPAQPAWAALVGLAVAMLPRWARRLYRLPGLPTSDLTATACGRVLRTSLLAVPAGLREGPQLRAARDRLAPAS